MKTCNRLNRIPVYPFSALDKLKAELRNDGHDIYDLSVGDPDLPTPDFIIDALKEGVDDYTNHRYPPYHGTLEFRQAVAQYYKRRFNVNLDPDNEVIALIGSKEGIAHITMGLIDEGDTAIVFEPAYPIYKSSVCISGGIPYIIKLEEKNSFLPDISGIDEYVLKISKLIYLNYPNNPTGAISTLEFYEKAIKLACKYDIALINDAAYNEIVYSNEPVSLLQAEGAKDIAVELGTLSKPYNMAGWRIGYAVGNKEIIKRLALIKENIDSGLFAAIQHAGAVALNNGDDYILKLRQIYRMRKDRVLNLFKNIGISYIEPKGGFYIWFKVPKGFTSSEFASYLLKNTGILITPGIAFGQLGEGYCRISLTANDEIFEKAAQRIIKTGLII